MSNNSSTSLLGTFPPSVKIFTVLVLLIGALLLATSGIDPNASVRAVSSATPSPTATAAPTLNPFASNTFKAFQSADGVLKVEYPDQWTALPANPSQPQSYIFSPGGTQNTSGVVVGIQVALTSALGIPGLNPNSTPREILTQGVPTPAAGQPPIQFADVKAGSLSGAGFHQTSVNQQTNQPQEVELWLVKLDATHVLLIQAIAPPGQWTGKLQPLFQHMMDTLSVNAAAIPTPTATPTGGVVVTPSATPAQ